MINKDIIILCRNRSLTVDEKRLSVNGMMSLAGHIRNKNFVNNLSDSSSKDKIKSKIYNNVIMPEWIGSHRFGLFDLLNYIINKNRYVYDPASDDRFFNPIGIPSITSLHIYDFLSKKRYNPINVDNYYNNQKRIRDILSNNPLAVAISATFLNAKEIYMIINFIRSINKDVPVIIGSSYLLSKIENDRLNKDFEKLISENIYIILDAHGFDELYELLKRKLENGSVDDINNVVYYKDGKIIYNKRENKNVDLDSFYPDWVRIANLTKDVAFVRTSQGCAFKCKFCTFPKASIKFAQRSVESIRNELSIIRGRGIKNLSFTDDHFAISPKRINDICNMMLHEKFDFNWFAGIRSTAINRENAKLLSDSGCKVLCVGLESGDDSMLGRMDKKTSTKKNMECLELLDKEGIIAYGSFLIGFPGETEDTVKNTINWINSSPLKLYKVFMFYLFPESIIWDEQELNDITFFGERYQYDLWKTPTMDALRISELLKSFILQVKNAALIYNYSPMYAFFPLLSKGYTLEESLRLLYLRTEMIKNELSQHNYFYRIQFNRTKMKEIRNILYKH